MAFTIVTQGSFTSTGATQLISLPSGCDYFKTMNLTQLATQQGTGVGCMFEWYGSNGVMANDYAIEWKKTNSTDAMNLVMVTSGGFTYYPTAPFPEAVVTGGTTITQAVGAVCTISNSYATGDRIRILGVTGMKQISGMDFTISSVSGAGFTLLGLDSSAFTAAGSVFSCRRIPKLDSVEPRYLYITGISLATNAVVTVSTTHSYIAGDLIHFSIPSGWGMPEINQMTGLVTAVGTYTLTVNINSSAFTAFAFPASSLAPTAPAFATLSPAGQRNSYDVSYSPFHSGQFVPFMSLAGGVQSPAGANSDVVVWQSHKMEN